MILSASFNIGGKMIDLRKNNFSKRELQESVMTRERIQTGLQAIFCRRRRQRRLRRESM